MCRRLQLEAHAGLVTTRRSIDILPCGDGSVVDSDKHPLNGRGARRHHGAVEAAVRVRDRRMLRRFAELGEKRH